MLRQRWLAVALLVASCAAQTVLGAKETDQQTLTVSGNTLTFPDTVGTQSNSFEVKVTGAPTTLSVTLNGCMRGGTCTVLATSTATTNSVVSTSGGPYDNYQLTGTWTGGTSPTLIVNRTGSSARKQSPSTTAIVNASLATGGDMAKAISAACQTLPSSGGFVDARGVPTPFWMATQPWAGCNKGVTILWPAGKIYTSNPIFMPGNGARAQMHGAGTSPGAGVPAGTQLIACYQGTNDTNYSNLNCGGNPFGFPIFPNGLAFAPVTVVNGYPTSSTASEATNTVTLTTVSGNFPSTFQVGVNVTVQFCAPAGYNITAPILSGGAGTNTLTYTDGTSGLGAGSGCSATVPTTGPFTTTGVGAPATTATFAPVVVAGSNSALNAPLIGNCFGEIPTDIDINASFAPNSGGVYTACAQELTYVHGLGLSNWTNFGIYCEGCSHTEWGNFIDTCKPACFNPDPGGSKANIGIVTAGNLVRASNIVTVTINNVAAPCSTNPCNLPWLPWALETINIVDASDPSFTGTFQICGPSQNASCITPTNVGNVTTFTYQNTGTNGASTAQAQVLWPQYGVWCEGGCPWTFNNNTVTGSPPSDNAPTGTGLSLSSCLGVDGTPSGVFIGWHCEDAYGDPFQLGQFSTTSGVTFIGMNSGGVQTFASGGAVVHYFPYAQGNQALSTYVLFNNRNIIQDDRNGYTWPGATSKCNSIQAEQCIAGTYTQGRQGVPGCYAPGAAPACGANSTGISQIAAAGTSVTIATTAVSNQSIIAVDVITANQGSLTCNAVTNPAALVPYISAVVPGVSFTITSVAPTGGTACYGWSFNN